MNILQLCNKSPLPPTEGGPMAMFHLAMALIKGGHQVDALAVLTPKFHPAKNELSQQTCENYTYDNEFINTDVTVSGAIQAFIRSQPYQVVRFQSDAFREKLITKLKSKQYDFVIFETLYMSPYLEVVRENSDAKCILRSHNIEHLIWERIARNEKSFLKRKYINHLSRSLKKFELEILPKYDAVACISNNEVQYYTSHVQDINAHYVPFGMNLERAHDESGNGSGFYHIGSMDWMPNIEGIRWFVDHVVPLLEQKAPEIKVFLAGRNMPAWLYELRSPAVEIIGEVPDAKAFAASKSVLIVPLLSGSGIRIKIIEAMSLGKAVVSTTIGAEGINAINGKDILLADTPEQFADSIIHLHNNQNKVHSLGEHATKLITDNHNYESVLNAFNIVFNTNV